MEVEIKKLWEDSFYSIKAILPTTENKALILEFYLKIIAIQLDLLSKTSWIAKSNKAFCKIKASQKCEKDSDIIVTNVTCDKQLTVNLLQRKSAISRK